MPIKSIKAIVLIILAVLSNTIPRWLPYDGLYFKMQALSILLWLIAADSKENDKIVLIVWEWAIGLAINNAYDEFFGDPVHVGFVEVTIAILITVCTLYRTAKCHKNTTKP